jgi:hypothetical protein
VLQRAMSSTGCTWFLYATGAFGLQVPPTVLVRVSHPIFHHAVDSTPAPLRPSGSGAAIRSSSGNLDTALQQEGKLGSLQVCMQLYHQNCRRQSGDQLP